MRSELDKPLGAPQRTILSFNANKYFRPDEVTLGGFTRPMEGGNFRRWMQAGGGALLLAGALLTTQPASAAPATYSDFVAKAQALRAGQTRGEIVAVLGKPAEEGATYLGYSLMGMAGMPPAPGSTVYTAAEIELKDGRMVGAVKWAWMDTTGMVIPPPKPHRKH